MQEGAYADATVKLGIIKLVERRFDLCDEAYVSSASPSSDLIVNARAICSQKDNYEVTCPVKRGTYTVKKSFTLPPEVPKGNDCLWTSACRAYIECPAVTAKFKINVQGYNGNDEHLVCIDVITDFRYSQRLW